MPRGIAIEGFDNIITEAVEKRVQLAITQAIAESSDQVLDKFVEQALHAKVKDGSSYREIPFMEKLSRDTVRAATEEAMKSWVIEAAPQIKAELIKQLGTVSWRRQFASAVLNGMINQLEKNWYDLTVTFEAKEER